MLLICFCKCIYQHRLSMYINIILSLLYLQVSLIIMTESFQLGFFFSEYCKKKFSSNSTNEIFLNLSSIYNHFQGSSVHYPTPTNTTQLPNLCKTPLHQISDTGTVSHDASTSRHKMTILKHSQHRTLILGHSPPK